MKSKTAGAKNAGSTLRFTPWRYFAPAALRGEESGTLPEAALDTILSLTGFDSLKELQTALDKVERNKIPQDLQDRLSAMLSGEVNPCACERDLDVTDSEGNSYELAFPFLGRDEVEPKIEIGAFSVKKSKGQIALSFRAQISAPGMLMPANKAAASMCELIAEGNLTDLSKEGRTVVAAWLSALKAPKALADDDDFLENLQYAINDRFEEILALSGNPDLVDEDDFAVVDCGEEERGVQLDESAATIEKPSPKQNAATTKPVTVVYQTKDRKLIINTDEDEWFKATCKVLKCVHLLKDPRFAEPQIRNAPDFGNPKKPVPMGENFPALHAELQKLVAEESADALEKKLVKAGVPAMKM